MQVILFTKIFRGCSAEDIGNAAHLLGVDGLDLAVRSGHCVSPANVTHELPRALRVWHEMNLVVPLVTLEGHATDPDAGEVQDIYAACAGAGIGTIKLGYWRWKAGDDYWQGVAHMRRALEGFQKLGERYNICSLLHTHSDDHYFSNAAAAMHVAHGFDSRYIGIYLDPAHLAADGESVPMALAIVGDYLHMVGVKNVRYEGSHNNTKWTKEWCLLREGLVDWKTTIARLQEAGYNGPLSLHAEYSEGHDRQFGLSHAVALAHSDMRFLRSLIAAS